ncbi:MAG: hypothetical protein FWE38_04940 [Firmicutes bacterium]|nr:hypothetical protein [Bacillota bacterium]
MEKPYIPEGVNPELEMAKSIAKMLGIEKVLTPLEVEKVIELCEKDFTIEKKPEK